MWGIQYELDVDKHIVAFQGDFFCLNATYSITVDGCSVVYKAPDFQSSQTPLCISVCLKLTRQQYSSNIGGYFEGFEAPARRVCAAAISV